MTLCTVSIRKLKAHTLKSSNRLMGGKTKKSITFGIDVSNFDGATNFTLDRSMQGIGVIAKFKHNTNSNIGFEEMGRRF